MHIAFLNAALVEALLLGTTCTPPEPPKPPTSSMEGKKVPKQTILPTQFLHVPGMCPTFSLVGSYSKRLKSQRVLIMRLSKVLTTEATCICHPAAPSELSLSKPHIHVQFPQRVAHGDKSHTIKYLLHIYRGNTNSQVGPSRSSRDFSRRGNLRRPSAFFQSVSHSLTSDHSPTVTKLSWYRCGSQLRTATPWPKKLPI